MFSEEKNLKFIQKFSGKFLAIHIFYSEKADEVVPEFSTSWSQSVSGKVTDAGENPIDAFGAKERKEEEAKLAEHKKEIEKKAIEIEYKLVKIVSDDEEEEEKEEEGEKKKSEFIDDEAMEVPEGEESMDEEEREYLKQQEIPENGIDIGSEDTDEGDEEEDDDEPDPEDTNFIAFSDQDEDDPVVNDSLDILEEKAEKVSKKKKRILVMEDSSDENEEIETYRNTSLTKFSGTVLSKVNDAEEKDEAEEADHDQDVTMVSLLSPSKKTPKVQKSAQKTLKSAESAQKSAEKTPKALDKSQKSAKKTPKSPEKPEKAAESAKKSAQKTPKSVQKIPQPKPVSRNLQSELEEQSDETPQKGVAEETEDVEMTNAPEEMDSPLSPEGDADEEDSESEEDDDDEKSIEGESEDGDDEQWEDIEEEEEKEKLDKTDSGSVSAILARCNEFLKVKREDQAAQKKINAEKRAKRRAAKEKKMRLKKELEEKKAEVERLREEIKEKKRLEKEAQEKPIVKEEVQPKKKVSEPEGKPQKKKKKEKIVEEETPRSVEVGMKKKKREEESSEMSSTGTKKKKKEKIQQEERQEEVQKKKKKKKNEEEDVAVSSGDSKRLPLALLNQLSDNRGEKVSRKKRRAEEDPECAKPQKKHKSLPEVPKKVETPIGMFNVSEVDPVHNPFSIRDSKLLRKAQVTKQFKREKKLKGKKKEIAEASCVFPRPTTSWTPAGIFTITDFSPQKKIVSTAGHSGSMEFIVTALEPKKKMSKKSQVTSVFSTTAEKPAISFKDQKLYGNGVVRETSRDLMNRNIKRKFTKM